ncbi:iron-regulated protein [Sphingobacteriales bacterium UPWRP_1]|nr:iron-regulated protein [Sphingobacteriales bacterium TSM_CSS]PSJ77306.1 iron-regulated protein [Sphingobacteriales bacterium UPWRP_1]
MLYRPCLPVVFILFAAFIFAAMTDKAAYRIFTKDGKPANYDDLLKTAQNADIVLFGELHNNPIAHWLQLELTKDLYQTAAANLVLGAEMFEADNQLLLSEYLAGQISQKSFEDEARLWKNYTTDYKPLVEFAKTNNLPFIATNIPRRYASAVFNGGLDILATFSPEAQQYIAPLPISIDLTLPGYQSMLDMGGHGGSNALNMPKAQAVKDATMAHFILKNLQKGKHFIHYNGAYHSNNYEGIVWYLRKQNPALKIVTISCTEQPDVATLNEENKNIADFIICTPENMTKTH